jgi:hypothetical protein
MASRIPAPETAIGGGGDSGDRRAMPADFRLAVAELASPSPAALRAGTEIGRLPAPTHLAPYAYAVSVTVTAADDAEVVSGRLVLLHNPDGDEAWEGTFRIVVFGTCEIDPAMASDSLLSEVAWSWLTERLDDYRAPYVALGGTVTATSSTRFGDIAGPAYVNEVELRASWTARTPHTAAHLAAFADFRPRRPGCRPTASPASEPPILTLRPPIGRAPARRDEVRACGGTGPVTRA